MKQVPPPPLWPHKSEEAKIRLSDTQTLNEVCWGKGLKSEP